MISSIRRGACALAGVSLGVGVLAGWPSAQQPGHPTLKVPDGFEVVRVAGPPLVERPIVADFDEEGRLYVAESSGSNATVAFARPNLRALGSSRSSSAQG